MSNIVRVEKYIKSDVVNNNNKFWYITLYDNGDVLTEWGRVGDKGQSKFFPSAGVGFLEKKCREKESCRNGEIPYRKLNVIGGTEVKSSSARTISVPDNRLAEVAKKQIKTNNPTVTTLIDFFAKVNAFQIMSATAGRITYNDTTGLFSTPLGIVTQSNIDEANKILLDIGDMVAKRNYDTKLEKLTGDLFMLVPQDIGHKRLDVKDFWANLSKVQYQKQIVDSLQASLDSASSVKPSTKKNIKDDPEEKVFDCQIHLVEDGKEIDRIRKFYNKTRQSIHASSRLDVKHVYSVDINTVRDAFEKDGAKMNNIWELWHGTKAGACLSIIRSGLKMPSTSSTNVTGKMFSGRPGKEGLYFSDQSTKSLNYATNYWTSGGNSDRTFMFLAQVAMGNHFTPNGPRNDLPRPGYDSTFAKANISGVMNNEMIVYRESQVNLVRLIEFTPNGK